MEILEERQRSLGDIKGANLVPLIQGIIKQLSRCQGGKIPILYPFLSFLERWSIEVSDINSPWVTPLIDVFWVAANISGRTFGNATIDRID